MIDNTDSENGPGSSIEWVPNRHYRRIVILTGAGVSAESGLGTFRGPGGLWENHRAEDIATPEAFKADPELVLRFYNERRRKLIHDCEPNVAHEALVNLERIHGNDFLLVTQNVDDLHERAGSKRLLHMHGELCKMRCAHSGQVFEIRDDFGRQDICTCCQITERLRPHVVWFGEMPFFMDEIYTALAECELFIAIGTSGHVYPAAGFVEFARQSQAHTLEVNLEPSIQGSLFHETVYGPATEVVPRVVEALLFDVEGTRATSLITDRCQLVAVYKSRVLKWND